MRLLRIRARRILPDVVTAPPDRRCQATTSKGSRCRLDAGPDGYCGVFHKPAPRGTGRPA